LRGAHRSKEHARAEQEDAEGDREVAHDPHPEALQPWLATIRRADRIDLVAARHCVDRSIGGRRRGRGLLVSRLRSHLRPPRLVTLRPATLVGERSGLVQNVLRSRSIERHRVAAHHEPPVRGQERR
jgi:hypothetical protein